MAKVSVIVPIYNVEKYLRECLDSLINQTLEDIEIICVNDGSTDSCPEILEEYKNKDSRIKVISKANSGYGHTMNVGLDNATGEYIGILESDDFAKLTMFEDLYNLAKANDADVVKSDWYEYWTKNNESHKVSRIKVDKSPAVTNIYEDKSLLNIQPSIWSAIYRSAFLKENNIRFLETPGASYQDTSFTYKVFLSAKQVVLTNDAYINYRQDNPNSSVKSRAKVYAICDEFTEIERFVRKNHELRKHFLEYIYSIQYRAYFYTLLRLDQSFAKDFIEYFSKKFKELYENKELGELFFSRNKKKELLCLINDKRKFYRYYKRKLIKNKLYWLRKKMISIYISKKRLSLILFGKQVVDFQK